MTDKSHTNPIKLTVYRVAGARGCGAASLYGYSYPDVAEVLRVSIDEVARAVRAGTLEPLSLVELALARKDGLGCLKKKSEIARMVRGLRPEVTRDVSVVNLCQRELPRGLDTIWAVTYADVAWQSGMTPLSTPAKKAGAVARGAAKSRTVPLDIRQLSSVLDFVAYRHPLLKESETKAA